MEAADEVFAGDEVDAGFATDGGVDLAEEGGGDLEDGHAAEEDGGEEAGDVGDDTAAEADDEAGTVGAVGHHLFGEGFDFGEALAVFAAGEEEDVVGVGGEGLSEDGAVVIPHVAGGDDEEAAEFGGEKLGETAEAMAFDEGFVLGGSGTNGETGHLLSLYHSGNGADAGRVGEFVAEGFGDREAVAADFAVGGGDFGGEVRTFVEQSRGAALEGRSEERQRAFEGGHGAGSDEGGGIGLEPVFGAEGQDLDVGEFQLSDGRGEEAGLLLDGFEQDELGVRQEDGKGDAGEAGARAAIGNGGGRGEERPGEDGVEDVLDGGVAGGEDAREIHGEVGLNDQVEVARGEGDEALAVGEIGREQEGEFVSEGHAKGSVAWGGRPRRFPSRGVKVGPLDSPQR